MSTPIDLRRVIKNEINIIFQKDYNYSNINIFEQKLPNPRKYENDESKIFPFVLISLEEGSIPSTSDKPTTNLFICVGVNQDDESQPEATVLLERIILYLKENVYFGDKYQLSDKEIKWKIGEDEAEPFEYGVIEAEFLMPEIEQNKSLLI